jgi:pilus assembly protein Flp/PilA
MKGMPARMTQLREDEEGATAVEYSLMVAAIATVIVTVVFALGKEVNSLFSSFSMPG